MYPIENLKHSDSDNFFLLAGPCVIENEELPFQIAEQIKNITDKLKIPFIFKASYKKANRSKIDSFTNTECSDKTYERTGIRKRL